MTTRRFRASLFLPPIVSLLVAVGIVCAQMTWNARVTRDLRDARREVAQLARLLPKGQVVPVDHDDDHDHHS